jgi:hypothetical protein
MARQICAGELPVYPAEHEAQQASYYCEQEGREVRLGSRKRPSKKTSNIPVKRSGLSARLTYLRLSETSSVRRENCMWGTAISWRLPRHVYCGPLRLATTTAAVSQPCGTTCAHSLHGRSRPYLGQTPATRPDPAAAATSLYHAARPAARPPAACTQRVAGYWTG